MNDLKIIVLDNKPFNVSEIITKEKLKDFECWQITTDEKLITSKYCNKILVDNNFETNILKVFLWKAKQTALIISSDFKHNDTLMAVFNNLNKYNLV